MRHFILVLFKRKPYTRLLSNQKGKERLHPKILVTGEQTTPLYKYSIAVDAGPQSQTYFVAIYPFAFNASGVDDNPHESKLMLGKKGKCPSKGLLPPGI